jgi:hypothetical protein
MVMHPFETDYGLMLCEHFDDLGLFGYYSPVLMRIELVNHLIVRFLICE